MLMLGTLIHFICAITIDQTNIYIYIYMYAYMYIHIYMLSSCCFYHAIFWNVVCIHLYSLPCTKIITFKLVLQALHPYNVLEATPFCIKSLRLIHSNWKNKQLKSSGLGFVIKYFSPLYNPESPEGNWCIPKYSLEKSTFCTT